MAEALKGTDAVISAFNAGWTNPNLYNDTVAGAEAIQKGVKASGVKRYIFIGGAVLCKSMEINWLMDHISERNLSWRIGCERLFQQTKRGERIGLVVFQSCN